MEHYSTEPFFNFCRGKTTSVELLSPKHYSVRKSKKVVLIDSSGLSIERTLEFWIFTGI